MEEDRKVTEAYKIMKEAQARFSRQEKAQDRFDVYGQHIASKLRTYSKRAEIMVEHAINNILFEADLGNYDRTSSESTFHQLTRVSPSLPSPSTSQYTTFSGPPAATDDIPFSNQDMYNATSTVQNFVATFNPNYAPDTSP